MGKKFISMLLAMALLSNSSIMFAKEQVNDDAMESIMQEVGAVLPDMSLEQAFVIKGDQFILKLNSKTYSKNGKTKTLTAAPLYIQGRIYIPLRFAVEDVLGGELVWNAATQTAYIAKDNTTLQMTEGSNQVILNDKKIAESTSLMVKGGTTYLPLKIISDYFGIFTEYNSQTQKVTIQGEDKGLNYKPVASFTFDSSNYVAGQTVSAVSTSYDPDGHQLVAKEWCVIDGSQRVTDSELSRIFKRPKAGFYTIGLRVKDEHNLWSEWTYQEITISPNEVPRITHLKAENTSYAQGQEIKYHYTYENEAWEEIVNEKWMYRRSDEEPSKAIIGRPDILFAEGEYIVTLQIDDAYGNRSDVYETTVHITNQILKKELAYRFSFGKIGDIIDNFQGFNYREFEDAQISEKSILPGTMIMSDSPEEVSREGILYRDSIEGNGRILMHHINRFSEDDVQKGEKRLVLVAENTSMKPVTFSISNKIIKGPSLDVLDVGQKLLNEYLIGRQEEKISLKAGEKKIIYDSGKNWKPGTTISGLMDVSTKSAVRFTIAAISAQDTISKVEEKERLLPYIHPRGTFSGIGIKYSINLDSNQPTKLILGAGDEEWVKGYDLITNLPAQNKGNYGVSYYITLTATQDTGIILNPRADTFRGAIEWKGIGVYNVPKTGTIFSNTAKAISLGTIKAGETKTFEYMLPNGSSAPVLIGFIPQGYWDH